MTNATVFIAMPAFGQVNCAKTTSSLMALAKTLIANGHDYYFCDQSFPDIAELRNMLATIWYDRTDAGHILFVDADMGFEPQLVLDMLAFDKPVVGCIYPKRTSPIQYVGQLLPSPMDIRDGFLKVKDVGAGVLLIHRDCFRDLIEAGQAKSDTRLSLHSAWGMLASLGVNRIIRAFDPIETDMGELSEDKSFCQRWRECGGDIWANIDHPITHVGMHGFTANFAERLKVVEPLETRVA